MLALVIAIGLLIVGTILLLVGADWFTGGTIDLSRVTVVSLGIGVEMIALGISAARKRRADILVGGILGSFAYNLLVTLGLAAVIRPIIVEAQLTRVAVTTMILAHLALLALIWYEGMSRFMGGLFPAGYIMYLVSIVLLR